MKFVDTPESKHISTKKKFSLAASTTALFLSVIAFGMMISDFAVSRGMDRLKIISIMAGIVIFGLAFSILGWMLDCADKGAKRANK